MIRFLIVIALYITMVSDISAAYFAGVAIDTSTNMLMRPDGDAGTFTSIYGGISSIIKHTSISYGVDTGFIEHYKGLQYQRHTLDAALPVLESPDGYLAFAIEGTFARYGDVTIIDGYEQYGLASTAKYYLTKRTLLRWEGVLSKRFYRAFSTENYNEAETFLRLDRFFDSGLTLRGQFDLGYRRNIELDNTPSSIIIGIRCRIAKSLGSQWGIWTEGMASSISSTQSVSDSTELFDRIFLDDPYKYSKIGLVLNTKHIFGNGNFFELRTAIQQRYYDGSLGNDFWYLPETGWEEGEVYVNLNITYQPIWIPGLVIPSLDMYYRDISASNDVLSYSSVGMILRFEFQ